MRESMASINFQLYTAERYGARLHQGSLTISKIIMKCSLNDDNETILWNSFVWEAVESFDALALEGLIVGRGFVRFKKSVPLKHL